MLTSCLESLSHRKLLIIFVNRFLTCLGMPCTHVLYWVCPPTTMFLISHLHSNVGLPLFHLFRSLETASIVSVHILAFSILLLINTPSRCVASPFPVILMFLKMAWMAFIVLQVVVNVFLCFSVPRDNECFWYVEPCFQCHVLFVEQLL